MLPDLNRISGAEVEFQKALLIELAGLFCWLTGVGLKPSLSRHVVDIDQLGLPTAADSFLYWHTH